MTLLCTLLAVTVISLVARDIWRERLYSRERDEHKVVVTDLLDRVMARSYGEFSATAHKASTVTRPVRRRVMSDEDMAELEASLAASRAVVAGRAA